MASKLFYGGRLISSPATLSQVFDQPMAPRNLAVPNRVAVVGTALGGKPRTPLWFQDPADMERVLRDGEGVRACRKVFAPSAQTGGPDRVCFVRVGNATQATLTLKDSLDAAVVDLESELYGVPANGIKVKVEAGSLLGKKITTQLFDEYYIGDNIAREAFQIRYAGAEATATMDVSATQVVLKAGASTVLTVSLVDAPTVVELVERLNTAPGFVAVATPGSELFRVPNALDSATAANVKVAAPAFYSARADLQAVVDYFNSNREPFVTAKRKDNVGTLPANAPFAFLSGATDAAATVGDWTDAIDVLQTVDVQWFVVLSDNPAVHAAADIHAVFMSGAGRKERRACVGPAVGTTKAQAILAAKALASERVALCYPGHYDFDARGNRILLPSYMTAALVAGGMAGMNPGHALTNKTLRMDGVELELRNPVDTDELINGGVLCVESTERGYKVVRSISTHLATDNFNRVELSCGAATDYAMRQVRERLDELRGGPQNPTQLHEAVAVAKSALTELSRPAPEGPGILVGDAKSPPFQGVRARIQGDVIHVTWEMSPVVPNNFITAGATIRPYSGEASA